MIYDTIMFFNEFDLLLLRMHILDPYVDYFVITESPHTHSGKEKPLFFQENRDKFKEFESKIIYNAFTDNRPEWEQWEREAVQRGASLGNITRFLNDEDVIISSDCDEIPDLSKIDLEQVRDSNKLFISYQPLYYYYLNTITVSNNIVTPWGASRLSNWRLLKRNSINELRMPNSYFCQHYPSEIVRVLFSGWHFSFLSNVDNIKYKIRSYSHQEFNNQQMLDSIDDKVKNLKDPFGREGAEIKMIEMTPESHPKYLLEHLDEYDRYIYKGAINNV
jgi:beta-1,4-mannosyl-glycoprotein beta-1,4-N-acetylglucosaminyltransferase